MNNTDATVTCVDNLITQSSLLRPLFEKTLISTPSKEDPEIGISLNAKDKDTSIFLASCGKKEYSLRDYSGDASKNAHFAIKLTDTKISRSYQRNLLLSSDLLETQLMDMTERLIVEFCSNEDSIFFNTLYDIKHLINPSRVHLTPENIVKVSKAIVDRTQTAPTRAYLFTNTEAEDNCNLLSMVASYLPESTRLGQVPIQALGLPLDASVLMVFPEPIAMGYLYCSKLPALVTTKVHSVGGDTTVFILQDNSFMVIPDIKVIGLLC